MPPVTWFDSARLGMFVHWGIASVNGWELSWPMVGGVGALPGAQSVAIAEYYAAAERFNPAGFDARALARLAEHAGMQYAVLTARHHDGFALFHTGASNFSIEHSPYRKDIVRLFVDAFRAEGLRVGLYFSLCDWHHPDYPAFTEEDKPYRWGAWRRPSPEAWERYVRFMFAQIRELLTNYGSIDLIWFDGGWERTSEEWRAAELVRMIRSLQPQILINDRLPGFGDFTTPEQAVPPRPPDGPWETCLTMNHSWGYNPADRKYKSARTLVHTICQISGKGGNLLLNVSPMADGTLPAEQTERLEAIASWMERNGESIVGTRPGLEPWQFYGPSTRRGDGRVYLHLLMRPYETISVRGVRIKKVRSVRTLAPASELRFTSNCSAADALFNSDPIGEIVIEIPERMIDPIATVIAIDFAA
jgi:alpha-L-fucosidase